MSWGSRLRAALAVALLAPMGCNKSQEEAGSDKAQVAPLPAAEVVRARKACESYVARVCACAEKRSELAEECSLARARPGALEVNLELMGSTGLGKAEMQAVKVEARKIAAACFEADSRLDVETCPRVAPGE